MVRLLAATALALLVVTGAAYSAAGPASNYGGWEDSSGAIMCQASHQGWQIYEYDPGNGSGPYVYRCQAEQHVGPGLYFQGWGYVASCPGWYPIYGWCWHWHRL